MSLLFPVALALLLPTSIGCASGAGGKDRIRPGDSRAARAAGLPEVRYRPVFDLPGDDARMLVDAVAGGQWDEGLAAAAAELLSLHADRASRIDAASASLVTARAGYPGQPHYMRALTGGAFPESLVNSIAAASAGSPAVDLGLAVRRFDDGTALWVLAWSRRIAHLDPLPRDLVLDQPLPVRVDLEDPDLKGADLRLFVAPPEGQVEEISLSDGIPRWVDSFHSPGEWRLEAVADKGGQTRVALLFSVFVDSPPPKASPLPAPLTTVEHPIEAEQELFARVNAFRQANGLPPVAWFDVFEPIVREHSAFMAASGQARHVIPGVTPGVTERARGYAFPFAFHHEAVATAPTSWEALQLVVDSPAHRKTLLCEPCTHATIGVALEPVLSRTPRLFVTWEMLELPKGPPKRIDTLDR